VPPRILNLEQAIEFIRDDTRLMGPFLAAGCPRVLSAGQ
jgi:hypothetical protein